MAGLGGAYFALRIGPTLLDDSIDVAGWDAIALVILSSWRQWRAIFAAYLFGAPARLGLTPQTLGEPWSNVPSTLPATIPFVLAIVVMIVFASGECARHLGAPAALGIPYIREQR